jgi:NADH-quinone oxidoreductase subunit J
MTFESVLFYFFAAILLVAGALVVTARNPVHAALFLVLAFVTSAALWLLIQVEFLAITLILVYVGAVMVLFLFVVMMLDINIDQLREGFWRYLPVGLLVAAVMVGEMWLVLRQHSLASATAAPAAAADVSNTKALGGVLYTQYVYAFELAAVILLVAIVSAIALTQRKRRDSKYQDPAHQVRVRRQDRVRLVSMPAEKRVEEEVKA